MAAHPPTDLDWSRKVAKVVVEALLFPKLIAWGAFDPALAVATDDIQGWLAKRDYPARADAGADKEKVDRAWADKVARSLVAKLVTAGFVTETESENAVELAQEEIWIALALDDRPPQQG